MNKYVAYYRVSTKKQGASGLGLGAQLSCVECFVEGNGELIASFTDVESGKKDSRPELSKAIALCRKEGAVLIIAKLDRLSRSVSFIFDLRDSGVQFVACDCPEFNTLTLGMFSVLAQYEREKISERTKSALAVKRKRVGEWRVSNLSQESREAGAQIRSIKADGNENNMRASAYIKAVMGTMSLQGIADSLNSAGYKTSTGCQFTRMQVKRLMDKIK